MKKLLSVLLVLLLFAGSCAADSLPLDALVRVCDSATDGTRLASGVLLDDGTVATAALGDGSYSIELIDGTDLSVQDVLLRPAGGIMYLTADGLSAGVTPADTLLTADTLQAVWTTDDGVASARVEREYAFSYMKTKALLVSSEQQIKAGALVLDEKNQAAGLIAAQWGSGRYYVAVPLIRSDVQSLTDADRLTLSWESGQIRVSWDPADMTGLGEKINVCCADLSNGYYSSSEAAVDTGTVGFSGVPGRTCHVCLLGEDETAGPDINALITGPSLTIPDAAAFTEHGYKVENIYIGLLPAGKGATCAEVAEARDFFTVAELEDSSAELFVQVTNTYQVTEQIEYPMLIVLTTPEGSNFVELSGFLFMPELCQQDVWNSNLASRLADYTRYGNGTLTGEYTVTVYINGQSAGSVAFTVTE